MLRQKGTSKKSRCFPLSITSLIKSHWSHQVSQSFRLAKSHKVSSLMRLSISRLSSVYQTMPVKIGPKFPLDKSDAAKFTFIASVASIYRLTHGHRAKCPDNQLQKQLQILRNTGREIGIFWGLKTYLNLPHMF